MGRVHGKMGDESTWKDGLENLEILVKVRKNIGKSTLIMGKSTWKDGEIPQKDGLEYVIVPGKMGEYLEDLYEYIKRWEIIPENIAKSIWKVRLPGKDLEQDRMYRKSW